MPSTKDLIKKVVNDITTARKLLNFPSLNYLEGKVLKDIIYYKTHGIYKDYNKHTSLNIAINSISFNEEKEDTSYMSGYHMYLNDYIEYQVLKYTGITFKEYLQLTPLETEFINEICKEITEEYNKAFEELNNNNNDYNMDHMLDGLM